MPKEALEIDDDVLADLDDLEEEGDGEDFDDDEGTSDGEDDEVLEQFGNDPAKLAKSYKNLQRKLGEQGRELGDIRKEMRSIREEKGSKGEEEGTGDDPDAVLASMEQKIQDGDMSLGDAFREFGKMMTKGVDEKLEKNTQQVKASRDREAVWGKFIKDNPDASKLEPIMVHLAKKNPGLLNANSPEDLRASLGDLMDLAVVKYHRMATRKKGGKGRMDMRRSRRARRTGEGSQSRSGAGSRDNIEAATEQALRSDKTSDWAKVLGNVLARDEED